MGCRNKIFLLSSYCWVACQTGKRESITVHRSQLQLTWHSPSVFSERFLAESASVSDYPLA